jgi:hypothetical protein
MLVSTLAGETLRLFCKQPGCNVAACSLCAGSKHREHALEDVERALGGLRGALAEEALATSCWTSFDTDSAAERPPPDAARCDSLLVSGPALVEVELSERLECVTATRAQLDAGAVAAAGAAASAFDEVISGLQTLKSLALADLTAAVTDKRRLLDAESEQLVGARVFVSSRIAGVRAALSHLSAVQFAAVYPALSEQLSSAMGRARTLPQVRLFGQGFLAAPAVVAVLSFVFCRVDSFPLL